MASNQVEARNRAQKAYEDAKEAGVTGQTLATLKADYDAKEAIVQSATGGSGGWGVVS